jgi:hypothetical protein
MVGGTFGVAVLGAMVATLGRLKIDQLLPSASSAERAHVAASLGSGEAPHGVPLQVIHAGQQAFVYALQYGLRLGSAVALAGALLAWTLIRSRASAAAPELRVPDGTPGEERWPGEQGNAAKRVPAETVHV